MADPSPLPESTLIGYVAAIAPTPWYADDFAVEIFDARGRSVVCEMSPRSDKERNELAALIVRSVNAHAALVEALRELVDAVERHSWRYEDKLSGAAQMTDAATLPADNTTIAEILPSYYFPRNAVVIVTACGHRHVRPKPSLEIGASFLCPFCVELARAEPQP